MQKRLVLAALMTVVLLLLLAPPASAINLYGIDPVSAYPGETVSCTVTGDFFPTMGTPQFQLRQGTTTISGSTSDGLWDAASAMVSFTIPASGAVGAFDLYGRQDGAGTYSDATLASCFTVVDTTPVLSAIDPWIFRSGSAPASFTITGSNFVAPSFVGGLFWPGSAVYWGDTVVTPTSVTATQIVFSAPPDVVSTPGNTLVRVRNPNGLFIDGPYSNTTFVSCVTPPRITSPWIVPASLPAGSPATTLEVYGDNFFRDVDLLSSTVTWDGADLPTTFLTSTHLQATVSADRLATVGTHAIRVRNGTGAAWTTESVAVAFDVTTPVPGTPVISGVVPASLAAGSPAQPITVNGTGFTADAVVYWNTTALTSTSVTPGTQLSAAVPASLLAAAGTANIIVHNGTGAGAPVSAPWAFTVTSVTPGTPAVTSLSPTTTTAGAAAFPLTVNGSGFIASSVVVWAGGGTSTDLVTTFVSAAQLTAQVPASLIATAGTATVTVRNGPAGSTVSGPLSFSITSGGGGGTVAITSLEPTQVWAGYTGPGVTLAVNGTGFVGGAHIWLGTHEKTATTFVSATRLTTTLLPADLASVGTIQVSVRNPGGAAGPSTLPLAVGAETTDPTVTIGGADSGWHNSPVTLTFTGADSQSGVQKVQYRCPPLVGSWTDGTSYTVPVTTQGVISVSAQVLDWCNHVGTAGATVRIDTTKPGVDALNAVSVKRGRIAKLRFRVSEPADLSPTATVVLRVKKGSRVVKTKTLRSVPMNSTETYSFKVNLKKGSYRWYISATDLAGNQQVRADWASFKVK